MKRLATAPNLALATLWADMLSGAGIETSVQRAFASGIVGHVPPDQALPELWIDDERDLARAQALLHEIQHPEVRRWACRGCGELIEGAFLQCWRCGAEAPP